MFGKSKPEVLIVGAGPVGLLAGLQLTRRGVPISIVDEGMRTAQHSYALALHGASLQLLDRVGLLDRVLANSHRVDTVAFYEGKERMAELPLADLGEPFGYVAVTRQDRLEGLLERSGDWRGLRVRLEARLDVCDDDDALAMRHRLASLCRDRLADREGAIEHLEAAGQERRLDRLRVKRKGQRVLRSPAVGCQTAEPILEEPKGRIERCGCLGLLAC